MGLGRRCPVKTGDEEIESVFAEMVEDKIVDCDGNSKMLIFSFRIE